jgi:formate-dependent nitrite reductase membrane component NrfD
VHTVEGAEPDIGPRPFLYRDTDYAAAERGEQGAMPADAGRVSGPVIKPPVWTWEIPLYFWLGGIAAGSSFVALACDLAGDGPAARTARRVALAAVVPCPPLLISDLGRPERFHHMLRIFKPRSPMNMGAWALTAFGALGSAAVAADMARRRRAGRALGAANAVVGGYVGSYTGVLLSTTAVPLWSRSRLFLGPIFVMTATATGAATVRLALGSGAAAATQDALARVETGAIACELALSAVNERRLGETGRHLRERGAYRAAKWAVRAGLALRALPGTRSRHISGSLFLAGGLAFRYAWVEAGKASAADDEDVARNARSSGRGGGT